MLEAKAQQIVEIRLKDKTKRSDNDVIFAADNNLKNRIT